MLLIPKVLITVTDNVPLKLPDSFINRGKCALV